MQVRFPERFGAPVACRIPHLWESLQRLCSTRRSSLCIAVRSRYDYEGVDSDKAEAVVSGLRDIIADPSKVRVCG